MELAAVGGGGAMSAAKSQTDKIAAALWAGERITALDALRRFGCLRLGGRIWDLKTRGVPVQSKMIAAGGKRISEYYIKLTDIAARKAGER